MSELDDARFQFEGEWRRLRRSLRRDVGTEPRWSRHLILPVLALAGGVLLGASLLRRRSRGR